MIIVTGATGQLGQAIVQELLQRIDPARIGVSVRDPAKAANLEAQGVRVRRGDFTDSASLAHAFEGATQVLIVSSDAERSGGDAIGQHRAAIAAAKDAGARRILYTSHMGAVAGSVFLPMHTHVATEALLRACGVPYTALRNGFYASSALRMLGDVAATHAIVAPPDGKVAWTTHADLAAAAAVILEQEGCFDGPTPPLTAQASHDFAGLAAIASQLLAAPVERRAVADEDYLARGIAHGMPEAAARIMRGYFEAVRAGEFAAVDPALARLIGRDPQTMHDVLARHFAVHDH